MKIRIYSSGNYVIVDDGTKIYEYAKGHTLYIFSEDVFYIKEITQGQFKVAKDDVDNGDILDELENPYTLETFTTFLRENTGFKTAAGGSAATVQNSDLSYTTTVNSGDTLNLPNITVTDSNGSTFTSPSVKNITCTPAPPSLTTATLMKTGQTTSYNTGDDGDIEAGREINFFTLANNNPFGNTNRFTSKVGTQVYTDSVVIDWSTYNGSTVLAYYHGDANTRPWATQCTQHLTSTFNGLTGWNLFNINQAVNIMNFSFPNSYLYGYAPFNLTRRYMFVSTNQAGSNAIATETGGPNPFTIGSKAGSLWGIWTRVCTVTGTTIT
jgi:hypothetical protein